MRKPTGNITQPAAWLALFAMMLIIIAPQISISLQQWRQAPAHEMHHDMPGRDMEMHDAGHSPAVHDEHAACGYCLLLVHTPGVIMPVVMLLLTQSLRRQRLPALTHLSRILACCRGRPPCRAPPLG